MIYSGNVRNLLCPMIIIFRRGWVGDLMFIKLACECEWETVNSEPDKPYKFRNGITNYMKDTYEKPAVYRWVIDNEYYVGETVNLCRRIGNYLNTPKMKFNEAGKMLPHQQTTNINLNARLRASTNNHIEFLKFDEIQFGDATDKLTDLNNNCIRLLVEKIVILDHEVNRQTLLNKD